MKILLLGIALAACFTQAHGQEHDFKWAMQSEDMRGLIFSFFEEEDWKTQNQIRQVNHHMRDLFQRETGIADERWQELETLQDHFSKLSRTQNHRTWFQSSNPSDWGSNRWAKNEKLLYLSIMVFSPDQFQTTTPVTHALENVVGLDLSFQRAYPPLDLDYIARLFPNLERMTLFFNGQVKSLLNLESLSKMPLETLEFRMLEMQVPLDEWLPNMTELEKLQLDWLALADGQTELDLRGLIPPSLEKFEIRLPDDIAHQSVRVLLSEDVITSREQPDGSVVHPLELYFKPYDAFSQFEMEWETLDPKERERNRPEVLPFTEQPRHIHSLTIWRTDQFLSLFSTHL